MANIIILCWRDLHHPQGGGSERYIQNVAEGLHNSGHQVHFITACYSGAARRETRGGIHFWRWGNRLTVYPTVFVALVLARLHLGPLKGIQPDLIIDSHNGIPFFGYLATRKPTIVLVHHVHKAQWPIAGRVLGPIGWWIESRLSPWVHRKNRYVTVSRPSQHDLTNLGIDPHRITIIRAGHTPHSVQVSSRDPYRLCVLSRLVPHKHIEHAIQLVAELQATYPLIQLDIIGEGWWSNNLHALARTLKVTQRVTFHGFVTETEKYHLLAGSVLHIMPSRAEGWCLAVTEAGSVGTPSIGYYHSQGLTDSIVPESTGILVHDYSQLVRAVAVLLAHPGRLQELGVNARKYAQELSWDTTIAQWNELVSSELGNSPGLTNPGLSHVPGLHTLPLS